MGSPPSKPRPVTELAVTSIRVERGVLDAFRKLAESNHRTVTQEMRRLMEEAVTENEQEAA